MAILVVFPALGDQLERLAVRMPEYQKQIRKQVLKCAPGAVADMKSLILALPGLSRAETVQFAAENFATRMLSNEGKEGVASFVEKRTPGWVAEP